MLAEAAIKRLQSLRLDFEQSTEPEAWPAAAEDQLLLLSDVCQALELPDNQARLILGEPGWLLVGQVAGLEQ